MLKLHFVRHGETKWNIENRVQGRLDSELTNKGIADVLTLKERIIDMNWEKVYSSPSGRALYTAELLCKREQITKDKRIMEMDLGEFEGMTWEEIKTKEKHQYDYYWNDPSKFTLLSGENFYDVIERVADFIAELKLTYNKGNILIVTHGVIIKVAQLLAQDGQLQDLWKTPHVNGATMTIVEVDQKNNRLILIT